MNTYYDGPGVICGKGRHAHGSESGGATLIRAFPVIIYTQFSANYLLKEMAEIFAYAVWFLCVCSLGNVFPVDSSHFMGGIIRWRPVNPEAFDGTVRMVALAVTMLCSYA